MAQKILFYVLIFQVVYYLATAIWPIMSLKSFMALAGPKPDRFLFWTVDSLILAIAVTILFGIVRGELITAAFLGAVSALVFIGVEVVFSGKISPWFWADTAVESIILLGIAGSLLASAL